MTTYQINQIDPSCKVIGTLTTKPIVGKIIGEPALKTMSPSNTYAVQDVIDNGLGYTIYVTNIVYETYRDKYCETRPVYLMIADFMVENYIPITD